MGGHALPSVCKETLYSYLQGRTGGLYSVPAGEAAGWSHPMCGMEDLG